MLSRTVLLLAVLALLAVPATAFAAGALPVSAMAPAQSTNISPTTTSQTFRVTSSCLGQQLAVIVATQSALDPDGILVAPAQVDNFALTETTPGIYEAATTATWLQTPGTYFWQAVAPNAKCDLGTPDGGPALRYASPTVGIVVSAVVTPSGDTTPISVDDDSEILTLNQAKATLGDVARKGTRRKAHQLSGRCTRRGSGSILVVFCTTRWSDLKTWTYNGTIRQALNDDGTITARFDGRRARLSCIKKTKRKVDEKACYHKYHFTAEV